MPRALNWPVVMAALISLWREWTEPVALDKPAPAAVLPPLRR